MNWIDDYLKYTSSQESPELFHRWCAVSIIAAVLNRRVWLDRRSAEGIVYFTNYPGQISVCLVAGAGRCKKSTAVSIAKSFMKDAGVTTFDGKITPEKLLSKLGTAGNKPVLTIVASELSTFLSKASYNDGLVDNLIKLLDCESNPYETQKATYVITNPCLTILAATTPFSMGKAIPEAAQGSGWQSRQIFVYSDKPGAAQPLTANISDIDPVRLLRLNTDNTNLVLYLRSLGNLAGCFEWTARAQTWYDRYYNDYRNSPSSESEGYAQRRPDHLARVALCLQVAYKPSLLLDDWALKQADSWLTEIEHDMPKALAFIGQHANAELQERVLRVFREQNGTGIDGPTLWYRLNRYFGGDQYALQRQLEGLMEAGIIEMIGRNTLGKKLYKFLREPY